MKICVASISTPNIKEMAEITVNNKIEYCKKNNYFGAFLTQTENYLGFDKILFIEGLLNTNKYDYIYWCDCDTLFTNFNKKIEDLIDEKYHFFISTDYSKDINAGVFIIKNSPEGRLYLNDVKKTMYELAHVNKFKFGEEQTALIATWRKEEYKNKIKIIPQKYMNAYPYSDIRQHPNGLEDLTGINGDWKPGDLMIHVAGFGMDFYKECVNHLRNYNNKVLK